MAVSEVSQFLPLRTFQLDLVEAEAPASPTRAHRMVARDDLVEEAP